MGLDSVELLISFEEAFGIEIPDDVAWTLQTPALVIDHVLSRQQEGRAASCPSMLAFHRLRAALIRESIATRKQIQPDAELESLLPRAGRRIQWLRLQLNHQLPLPGLIRSRPLTCSLIGTVGLGTLAICYCLYRSTEGLVLSGIITAVALGSLAYRLTEPLAVHFQPGIRTVGDLAKFLVTRHPKLLTPHEPLSREQIAATVKAITIEYCNPKHYREDAHFVKDLGLD